MNTHPTRYPTPWATHTPTALCSSTNTCGEIMTKVDELMKLIEATIKLYAYHATDDVMVVDDGKAINAVREALAAALKPGGEPIGYRYKFLNFMGQEVWSFELPPDGWVLETVPVYTAAPPAQTPPKGLFVDLIAQHPGLAEELKAIDDAPMPTWTPPPRLTEWEVNEIYNKWAQGKRDGTTFTDAIQDAVRRQFVRSLEAAYGIGGKE